MSKAPTQVRKKRVSDYDHWSESKFGKFNKFSNSFYLFLKTVYALGGDPEYVLKLAVLFSQVNEPIKEAKRSPKKRVKGGIHPETYMYACEPALKEFGWMFFLEILRNIEDIYKLLKTPPRTIPSQELLDLTEIGGQIMKKCLERIFRESAERVKETRQKARQEIANDVKARPFGDIIYEYAFYESLRQEAATLNEQGPSMKWIAAHLNWGRVIHHRQGYAVTSDTPTLTQKAAVIYGRVSSQDQVLGYSLEAQLKACRQWAEKNGHKVNREYVEEGHSAFRNLDKREAFKELLCDAALKQHPFDLIIVHKLDRLFRDSLESSTTRAILKQKHVRLVSVTEPMVGSDSPEDFFMEHILVGMAEFYSRNLSREIMKGLKQRAQQGHLVFRPPYGYRREIIERQEGHKRTRIVSRPVIDEKAAVLVKRIFEQFDQGMGHKSIVVSLNDKGYRTEQGQRFRVHHIARILRNKAISARWNITSARTVARGSL
jgi:DNA invertase Pin-like site-specific DNA recombinase